MSCSIHRCELSKKPNIKFFELERYYFSSFLNKFWFWMVLDENHPRCKQYLVSLSFAKKERHRQAVAEHWWVIHPFSQMRLVWEVIMTALYFIAFITIPFSVCFVILDYEWICLDKVNFVVYAICWIDIIINSLTGYYEKNKDNFVMDQTAIFKRYLKTYLFIDIISSLPYDHITQSWRKIPGPDDSFTITLINLLPLLKLCRYVTFISYIQQINLYFGFEEISCQMFLTLLLYLYVVHWFTCFSNLTALIMMFAQHIPVKESEDTWLVNKDINGTSHRYQRALFIVLENFTASGYGGVKPESEGHIILCTVLMVLGRLFESYIIIMLMQIVAARKSSESTFEQIINQLCAYGRRKQLPTYMRERLLSYYQYRFRNSYFREKNILNNLSAILREEVVLHSCRRLVENVEIFQELPKSVLTHIIITLKPELYLAQDMIIKAGTQGDCMFFLSSGTVAVLTPTGKEVCFLEDGAYFGEVALLVQDQRRVASVVAVEVCDVYRLDRKDFRKYIAVHSDLFAKVERLATERMQRTILIEEQHKRFMMHARSSAVDQLRRKSKKIRN